MEFDNTLVAATATVASEIHLPTLLTYKKSVTKIDILLRKPCILYLKHIIVYFFAIFKFRVSNRWLILIEIYKFDCLILSTPSLSILQELLLSIHHFQKYKLRDRRSCGPGREFSALSTQKQQQPLI